METRTVWTISGRAAMAAATTAPGQEKIKRMPGIVCSSDPAASIKLDTVLDDQVLTCQAVDEINVGGGEQVVGRAVLDLLSQHAGRSEYQCDLDAGLLFIEVGDLLEGEHQVGGGCHGDLAGLSAGVGLGRGRRLDWRRSDSDDSS